MELYLLVAVAIAGFLAYRRLFSGSKGGVFGGNKQEETIEDLRLREEELKEELEKEKQRNRLNELQNKINEERSKRKTDIVDLFR
jgi:hypothetical protein